MENLIADQILKKPLNILTKYSIKKKSRRFFQASDQVSMVSPWAYILKRANARNPRAVIPSYNRGDKYLETD